MDTNTKYNFQQDFYYENKDDKKIKKSIPIELWDTRHGNLLIVKNEIDCSDYSSAKCFLREIYYPREDLIELLEYIENLNKKTPNNKSRDSIREFILLKLKNKRYNV